MISTERFSFIVDNAMLYKDITQWLRKKTFGLLFFGLLILCELISFTVFGIQYLDGGSAAGPAIFWMLFAVLIVYVLIVTFMGYLLTVKEYTNKTFELYELSGMSLEKIVMGKLLSMMVQFFFGFFCIVPFMFFSFVLGGIDFYLLVSVSFISILFSIPLFLISLMISLASKKSLHAGPGRMIAAIIVVVFFIIPGILQLFSFLFMGAAFGAFNPLTDYMKMLVSFDFLAWLWLFISMAFYTQFCLLIFYQCCNLISPEVDSRTTQLKVISFTICASWFAVPLGFQITTFVQNGFLPNYTSIFEYESLYAYILPIYFIALMGGLFIYAKKMEVPIILKLKKPAKYFIVNLTRKWFAPSVAGTFNWLISILLLSAGFFVIMSITITSAGFVDIRLLNAISLPLSVPFFLAFPAGLLITIKALRKNITLLKVIITIWWVVSAVVILIVYLFVSEGFRSADTLEGFVSFIGVIISPVSSAFYGVANNQPLSEVAPILRIPLGIVGIFILLSIIRKRKKLEEKDLELSFGVKPFSPNKMRSNQLLEKQDEPEGENNEPAPDQESQD